MGLGLYLHGDCERPRDALLEEISGWACQTHEAVVLRRHIDVNERGHRALWLSLHPAEEPLELSVTARGQVLASARTSGAGPGYHAFVCELLDDVAARFAVRWQTAEPTGETSDDTGYFQHRDRSRLEAEMRGWLRAVARSLHGHDARELTGIAISMPVQAPQFEAEGVATPLGPRDGTFWRETVNDDAAAAGFFPWWEPGTGAGYLLGRALCRMWTDVRWCPPRTKAELQVQDEVLKLLKRAFELDPARAFPFAEWGELVALRGERLPEGARAAGAPTIGYRRRPLVARPFPGVSVRVPGAFSEGFDKRGSWSAWVEGRTVWASLQAGKKRDAPIDAHEPVHEQFEENGEPMHRVRTRRVAVNGDEVRVLVVTVVFTEAADVEWALETARSAGFR